MRKVSWTISVLAFGAIGIASLLLWPACPVAAAGLTEGNLALKRCDAAASGTLSACFGTARTRLRKCYLDTGQACPPDDVGLTTALARVATRIQRACVTDGNVQALGYGPNFTIATLTSRLQTECLGAAQSVAARTFGGPQAAILNAPPAFDTPRCLKTAYSRGATLLKSAFRIQSNCLQADHKGRTCDHTKMASRITAARTTATNSISRNCSILSLDATIGLDETRFADRALEQARCMVATAHADVGSLTLDCGPRPDVPVPARGVWTQVILDSATWGTQCGTGGPYAFWIRLAPDGASANRAIVLLQGGGVCLSNCGGVNPGLWDAVSDGHPSGGILSASASTNPFSDWTMMFLPYCTQDIHIGAGVDSVDTMTVHRYGALNVRAALRYLRDAVWAADSASAAEGYRPDLMQVLFTGMSAGAFGVQYNYHYVLDDLRWIHTSIVPDSGLALDNGISTGVKTLGAIFRQDPPTGWATRRVQPPYCFSGECAVGPTLQAATSVRLKAVPEQQILNVSNQVDDTQRATTYFSSMTNWTNAARTAYCATQGLNGVRYWLPADATSFHGFLTDPTRWDGTDISSEGVSLREWLSGASSSPDAVVDVVEEGTLVSTLGVAPFACPVGP